jgi:hypothetical protein
MAPHQSPAFNLFCGKPLRLQKSLGAVTHFSKFCQVEKIIRIIKDLESGRRKLRAELGFSLDFAKIRRTRLPHFFPQRLRLNYSSGNNLLRMKKSPLDGSSSSLTLEAI